jgi:hypothetical protein
MIENLEHLFMRTARGNGLIGVLLGFMSRTDSRVCWIGTLAEQAWSYVEKVEAMRARLVRRHSLTALTTADLEAVISNRHARSGLNLDFQVPASTSPMLRRRLAKAPDNQERQRILRTEYFDQLARFAGQNLLLAIFYWLRSIEPDAESSSMRVRPVQPLSFGYMADLSLSQSFTLKAFLEHATLTLDEHDRIFETSREESRYLFESLGNLLLLESADVRERISEFTFTTVDADRRYRLRPLVVHPVLTHLLSKNLVL